MVTDLHDAECDKRQQKSIQRLEDATVFSSKMNSWKIHKKSGTKNLDLMPQISDIIEPSSSCQFQLTAPENITTLSSTYLRNTIVSTANSFLDESHKTLSLMTELIWSHSPNI